MPAKMVEKFAADIVDTSGKFAANVIFVLGGEAILSALNLVRNRV
jgi:hypothetical protein